VNSVERKWWVVEMENKYNGEGLSVEVYAASLQEAFSFASEEEPDAIPVDAVLRNDQGLVT
jgi:hypothetical protein